MVKIKLPFRHIALAIHLEIEPSSIVQTSECEFHTDEGTYEGTYLVMNDYEADNAARESVESYLYDTLNIPDNLEPYFNRDEFIDDAIRIDGRGHILAAYDGEELEFNGNDELTILQYVRQHWQDLIDMSAIDENDSMPSHLDSVEFDDDTGIGEWLYIYRTN